jgi:hypothetical protein
LRRKSNVARPFLAETNVIRCHKPVAMLGVCTGSADARRAIQ